MYTVDASVAEVVAEVVARGNLDTTVMSPLYLGQPFVRREALRKSVFEPSMTDSKELLRAGSPGVLTPR